VQQRRPVEIWSEKGTVRGALSPVLNELGVTFRALHGYCSATVVRQIANESRRSSILAFYVGDWDPSGLHMSEVDLPRRLDAYGADVDLVRIALTKKDTNSGLPEFAADTKRGDPRHRWFVNTFG